LPPNQRQDVVDAYRRFQTLPPEQRQALRQRYRQLTPEQRQALRERRLQRQTLRGGQGGGGQPRP
jgi:TRAP-type C4-dicarboxylate transport system substrate-binding protein